TCISCGILLLKYPPDDRIKLHITENVPEMLFLYSKPAFIFFTKMDQFIYAQIGMIHVLVAVVFYVVAFLYVMISLHLVRFRTELCRQSTRLISPLNSSLSQNLLRLRSVMSANTITMHHTLIKALLAQMILPMISLCFPLVVAAATIKLGSKTQLVGLVKVGSQIGLIIICSHSLLNTISMLLYVRPF
ncbi:hypothetical protein PFISCL1PPCAC_28186, partial [Pristionchus fissidentatus]